jgi:hypothetical protein
MPEQIYQNADTTTGTGKPQFPLIHHRRLRQVTAQLEREYSEMKIPGEEEYLIGSVRVWPSTDGVGFHAWNERQLTKALAIFDLPRDTESRHIVAPPKDE